MFRKTHGFTIVELLIVIVIIAILAAITLVSYNGITRRANDSARIADATSLGKKVQLYQVDAGTYGYGSTSPAARKDFLSLYQIQSLSGNLNVCGYDPCERGSASTWDVTKVYVSAWVGGIGYAYWSNQDKTWHSVYFEDDGGESTYTGDGPLGLEQNII